MASESSCLERPVFQFHKGAIKTRKGGDGCTRQTSFNSIKVRLRRIAGSPTRSQTMFQFHKGAIKT